jgi:hypothetical protein
MINKFMDTTDAESLSYETLVMPDIYVRKVISAIREIDP